MSNVGRKQFGTTPGEAEIVKLIKLKARVRKGGKRPSLLSIAVFLNDNGYVTRSEKQWRAQTVKDVLSRSSQKKSKQRVKKTALTTGDFLSKDQLTAVFAAARSISKQDLVIVVTLAGSGLRASELCALQVRDLGIFDGRTQIDVRRGKGAKQRSVYISDEVAGVLRDHLDGRGLPKKSPVFVNKYGEAIGYSTLYKKIKRVGQVAGIHSLHPHSLRHTLGTLLYHYRKDLFFVMQQLGHSKVETTQIYAKTLDESKLEQLTAFGNDLSGMLEGCISTENTSKRESGV